MLFPKISLESVENGGEEDPWLQTWVVKQTDAVPELGVGLTRKMKEVVSKQLCIRCESWNRDREEKAKENSPNPLNMSQPSVD